MKILQVLTELGAGGAERVALDLSEELLKRGHEVALTVLKSPPKNRTIADRFLALRIVPEYLHMDRAAELYRLYLLRRSIRRAAPDICHSHLMHPNLCTRLAGIGLGIPLLNTIHISERRPGKGLLFAADRLTFPLCSACSAVSFASARFHERMLGLKRGTIKVIYNGVDPIVPPSGEWLRSLKEKWGLSSCSRIIGSIGRLDPQKGFDFLLSLLPELSARVPAGEHWGIVIVGEGPEMDRLRALAAQAPENLTVVLPGFLEDAQRATYLFDLFVMPSRYEGYGLVLAEAMTTGVPVVVNPVDSLPELCRFYKNHASADFASPERRSETAEVLAQAVFRPRGEPQVISRRGEMAERYIHLYESLLGAKH